MKKNWLIGTGVLALAIVAGLGMWGGLFSREPQNPVAPENSAAQTSKPAGEEDVLQDNLEILASHLQIPSGTLDTLFQAIRDHGVPPLQVHQLLLQKTSEFNDLKRQLEPAEGQDPGSLPPYAQAVLAALESGDFSEAKNLLTQFLSQDENAGMPGPEKLKAHTQARLGRIENLQLEYEKAADYFGRAGEAAGADALALQSDLLGWQGTALYLAGRFDDAETAYKQSLKLAEQAFFPLHPAQVNALNNLAGLYRSTGKLKLAEPLYLKAIEIRKKALGPRHVSVAGPLNDLASLYLALGDYKSARVLLEEALDLREQAYGPDDPSVAAALNNLANLYQLTGDMSKAQDILERSLGIIRKALGPDHIRVAMSLNNLAQLSQYQGDLDTARTRYLEALAISEKVLGPVHPDVAAILINLAELDMKTDRLDKAEILWRRALNILEATVGPQHPDVEKIKAQLAEIRLANARKSVQ